MIDAPARGRPRSMAADAAIRQATLDLLAESGYDHVTMAGVAAAAGVSTATLYRRWKSKEDLVVGALAEAAEETPVPDTGSLEGDCRAVLRQLVANLTKAKTKAQSGLLLAGLVSEMSRNPALAQALRDNLIIPRRAALGVIISRARSRKELGSHIDADLLFDLLFGPVHHRLLITGQPLTPRLADNIAGLVAKAVK